MARPFALRRALRVLLFALTSIVVVVLVALALLQTNFGKNALVSLATRLASGPERKVSIERLEGSVPFDMTLYGLSLADARGPWLTVDRLRLAWRPSRLLSGVAAIEAIEADRMRIERKPETAASPPEPAQPLDLSLPRLPLGIVLEKLSIADLSIAEPVFGHAARLRVNGYAALVDPQQGLITNLDATRIDGTTGTIAGRMLFTPDDSRLLLDLKAEEPQGGLVSTLLSVPSLSATLKGDGPLDRWRGDLALTAAGRGGGPGARANGAFSVTRQDNARVLAGTVDGEIAGLLPPRLRPLVNGRSTLTLAAAFEPSGVIRLRNLDGTFAAGRLTGDGRLDTSRQGIEGRFSFQAADSGPWIAPLTQDRTTWRGLRLDTVLGGSLARPTLTADLTADALAFESNRTGRANLRATAAPTGDLSDPRTRFNFDLRGTVERPVLQVYPGGFDAGTAVSLQANGQLDRSLQAQIANARIDSQPVAVSWQGTVSPQAAKGRAVVERADLALLSPLLRRDLAGRVSANADLDLAFDLSRVAVTLDASGEGLRTGEAIADRLLGGTLKAKGGIERAPDGSFGFRAFALDGQHVSVSADGSATPQNAAVQLRMRLPDLSKLDPRLTGRGDGDVNLTGNLAALAARGRIGIAGASASGRRIKRLDVDLDARTVTTTPEGTVRLSGSVDGKPATGGATFAVAADRSGRLDNLDIALGSVRLTGAVTADARQMLNGRIALNARELRDAAPLLLADLAGGLDAEAVLSAANGAQNVRLSATPRDLVVPGARIGSGRIEADARDLFGRLVIDGKADLANLTAGGTSIPRLALTAKGGLDATDVTLSGDVEGFAVSSAANIQRTGQDMKIGLRSLRADKAGRSVALARPADILVSNGEARFGDLSLRAGSGTLRVDGRAGRTLDLRVAASALPLWLSDMAKPGLGLDGTLSGEANLSGEAARPNGRYRLNLARLSATQIRDAGLRPFDVTASGGFADGRVTTETNIRGASNMSIAITGSAPMAPDGALDLGVKGRFDLSLANDLLAASGQRVAGQGTVDVKISGPASAPRVGGNVSLAGGRFDDPINGVTLTDMQVQVQGDERRLTISRFSARARNGGALTGSGHIDVDPGAGFPAQIEIRAANAQLVSSDIANLLASGAIQITGPVMREPRISGRLDIANLEITLPDKLPFSATPIPVRHIHAPREIRLRLAKQAKARAESRARAFVAALDVTVSAPSRIFVRGQGANAELGGQVNVRGTSAAPQVAGEFDLKRGTLDVIGKRLTLTRGRIYFPGGTLDPELDFVAEAPASDVTARVLLTGRPSDPKLEFTSSPELPRDEVLSRLLFGKASGKLTSSQTIQLAQALGQLTGVTSGLDDLRKSLGVDALDIGADDKGTGLGVGLGRRLNDNTYVGVTQGATPGSSKATVNIDLGRGIKIQGEAGANGDTGVGLGYEYEY